MKNGQVHEDQATRRPDTVLLFFMRMCYEEEWGPFVCFSFLQGMNSHLIYNRCKSSPLHFCPWKRKAAKMRLQWMWMKPFVVRADVENRLYLFVVEESRSETMTIYIWSRNWNSTMFGTASDVVLAINPQQNRVDLNKNTAGLCHMTSTVQYTRPTW